MGVVHHPLFYILMTLVPRLLQRTRMMAILVKRQEVEAQVVAVILHHQRFKWMAHHHDLLVGQAQRVMERSK